MNANRWRNGALVLMFAGFFTMYGGVYKLQWMPFLLVLGSLGVLAGILIYFRFGPVNPRLRTMDCPRCGERIRLAGERDACPHCRLALYRTAAGTYEPHVPPDAPQGSPREG
ncbi:hypothetical protein GCM10010885_13470 [Alicyclobacillus cellulosilyticus]|uniref:Zinc ribbon protein n=1 Tax=Alicyclobacillus cellulosilyticus TaxID=1003997 RepID=A0A917K9R2_9BACL|nr:DUF2614 family zinc ribbon-containing protein [Alicyclobacillus cellulosilyticus]GGJ05629.1 hypothetical protein GCM10010885_13470 [Alicyclobacillus cellulosilyticus]